MTDQTDEVEDSALRIFNADSAATLYAENLAAEQSDTITDHVDTGDTHVNAPKVD
jgi:hypothetical protein